MSKSLAAVFEGTPHKLELRELAVPQPQGEEMIVRVLGCTLCGSDLHSYEGRRAVPVPTVLGHEIVGKIETLGDSAERRDLAGNTLQLGDRIAWAIVASCGKCFYCRRGLPQKCQRAVKYGHEAFRPGRELLGGLAEHCLLVRGTAIVKLPDEIPLAA
ncbi:MAG TPA: alcohol dehydrogenase catalytic domain-containing protein, partial [Pirellulales bacterium]|nr:alcohol dehydrogenase catalytic domain-containing protein [Pirellulales bacterium]